MTPVLTAPNKVTNRGTRVNVTGAGTGTRGVDVVVVIAMVTSPSFNCATMDFPSAHFGSTGLLPELTTTVISRRIHADYVEGR